MKSVNIRTLKHETAALMERVAVGESLEVRRRNRPVAILSPIKARKPAGQRPDFKDRLHSIYGDKVLPRTSTDLLAEERGAR